MFASFRFFNNFNFCILQMHMRNYKKVHTKGMYIYVHIHTMYMCANLQNFN